MRYFIYFVIAMFSTNIIFSQVIDIDSTNFSKNIWQNMGPGYFSFSDFALLNNEGNSIIVSSSKFGIFKTFNGGSNWFRANDGLDNLEIRLISVSPEDTNKIFAATFTDGLYMSDNGGINWQGVTFFDTIRINNIAFDTNSPDTIYVGTDSLGLFRSVDSGKNWNSVLIPSSSGVNYVAINPLDSKVIYFSTYYELSTQKSQLFKSNDFGLTWTEIYSNDFGISSIYINPDNPSIIFINTNDGKELLKSVNSGINWESVLQTDFFITDVIFHPQNENIIFTTQYKQFRNYNFTEFIRSKDGGNSWSSFTRFSLPIVEKFQFAPKSVSTLFALDYENGLYKISKDQFPETDDELLSYYPLEIGNKWRYFSRNCTVNCDTVYFTESIISKVEKPNGKEYFRLYRSRNFESFIRIDTSLMLVQKYDTSAPDSEYVLYDLYSSSNTPYAVFDNNKIYNFDIVKTGYAQVGDLGDSALYKEYEHDGLLGYNKYLSQNFGPSYFTGGEGNFYEQRLIGAVINGVEYGVLTNINEDKLNPAKFVLEQNYPNPFNPTTTIKYSIPSRSVIARSETTRQSNSEITSSSQQNGIPRNDVVIVTLKVYDVLGREVATLVNKQLKPGNYKTVFNASNLSSGIYYYSLNINGNIVSKKMVYLK